MKQIRLAGKVLATFFTVVIATSAYAETPAPATAKNEAKRPNIVIILGDDLGFADMGSFGSEIKTPHLDSLAKDRVRFTNFYTKPRAVHRHDPCC